MSVSPTAEKFASAVAPKLQLAATQHRDDFVASAGGPLHRAAAAAIFPTLVRQVPTAAGVAADAFLTHFGTLSVSQIMAALIEHSKTKGLDVDPSVRAYSLPG